MPTPVAETRVDETPGVGTAAKQVAEHASMLARLELELAGLELKRKAGAFRTGVGLGAVPPSSPSTLSASSLPRSPSCSRPS